MDGKQLTGARFNNSRYFCPNCKKELNEDVAVRCTCPYCHSVFEKPEIEIVPNLSKEETAKEKKEEPKPAEEICFYCSTPLSSDDTLQLCSNCKKLVNDGHKKANVAKINLPAPKQESITSKRKRKTAIIYCPYCGYNGEAEPYSIFAVAGCASVLAALIIPIIGWLYLLYCFLQGNIICPSCGKGHVVIQRYEYK